MMGCPSYPLEIYGISEDSRSSPFDVVGSSCHRHPSPKLRLFLMCRQRPELANSGGAAHVLITIA